jgi:hypothetical protein
VLAYPAAERSPTRRPGASRDGPPEGRGPIRRAARRERSSGCTGKPGDRPPARSAWLPEQLPGKPPRPAGRGITGTPHTSSVASCAATTVGKRPTVVIGDSPGGSSSRTQASHPSASAVVVPWIFPFHVPDQLWASSCRQVRPGPSSGSGSGCWYANWKPSRQSPPHLHEHTFGFRAVASVTGHCIRSSCPFSSVPSRPAPRPRGADPRSRALILSRAAAPDPYAEGPKRRRHPGPDLPSLP